MSWQYNIYQKQISLDVLNMQKIIRRVSSWSENMMGRSSSLFSTLSPQAHPNHDLIFIRHAESVFNQACEDYRLKHNIPYVWEQLCNHSGFDQAVLFNPKYIDCPLTPRGKEQATKARYNLWNTPVDCVLVSPQLRALQTCRNIFGNSDVPVVVEPSLIGPIRCCSDISSSISAKKKEFHSYDFSEMEKHDQLWFLDYLNYEQRKHSSEHFYKHKIHCVEEKRLELVKLIKQKKILEGPKTYQQRVENIKNKLKIYREKYDVIAIVTHYYTIQYLNAVEFEEDGSPKYFFDIKNCFPYFNSLENLRDTRQY